MDLAPGKSFVEWAVTHGHTVFAISYVNPGAEHRDFGFDDYLANGPLAGARRRAARSPAPAKVNVGGAVPRRHARGVRRRPTWRPAATTGSAIADDAEHAARLRASRACSARSPTPSRLDAVDDDDAREGLPRRLARWRSTFDALRANDLIWNYVVERLADGRAAAGVRPARLERRRDPDARPHARRVPARAATSRTGSRGARCGCSAAASSSTGSTSDIYYVAAEEDHITPWMSCYDSSAAVRRRRPLRPQLVRPHRRRRQPARRPAHAPHRRRATRPTPRSGSSRHDRARAAAGGTTGRPGCRRAAGRRGKPPPIGNDDYPALCEAPGHVRARAVAARCRGRRPADVSAAAFPAARAGLDGRAQVWLQAGAQTAGSAASSAQSVGFFPQLASPRPGAAVTRAGAVAIAAANVALSSCSGQRRGDTRGAFDEEAGRQRVRQRRRRLRYGVDARAAARRHEAFAGAWPSRASPNA